MRAAMHQCQVIKEQNTHIQTLLNVMFALICFIGEIGHET